MATVDTQVEWYRTVFAVGGVVLEGCRLFRYLLASGGCGRRVTYLGITNDDLRFGSGYGMAVSGAQIPAPGSSVHEQ